MSKHPFNVGYDARLAGKDEYDNPHPSGSWKRNAWQHGWDEADENTPAPAGSPATPEK